MPLSPLQAIAVIATVVAVTVCCRALPFLVFRDDRPVSGLVVYLGRILPFAIISILVIYCLRNTRFIAAPFGAPEIIAVVLAAAIHVWKRNNLLSIGISTAVYMFLLQVVFV